MLNRKYALISDVYLIVCQYVLDELVKKYGGKVGMGCVQEQPPYVPCNIHKPHLHTYPYMWCLEKLPILGFCIMGSR